MRNNYPDLMGIPVNRALGVVVAGDEHRNARGFGHTNSPLAFGHGGAGGQIAWGDPATGISLGYCTSGHDRNVIRQARRGIGISSRAASCASDGLVEARLVYTAGSSMSCRRGCKDRE